MIKRDNERKKKAITNPTKSKNLNKKISMLN